MNMAEIRLASVEDIEIWKNLREWLPNSFVDPELELLLALGAKESLKQQIESKDGSFSC
ncbi:MAG: hypothetical protein ACUVTE_04235 [Candidatus Bathycorpusculaceae bacterium]